MPVTKEEALRELARRELARREAARSKQAPGITSAIPGPIKKAAEATLGQFFPGVSPGFRGTLEAGLRGVQAARQAAPKIGPALTRAGVPIPLAAGISAAAETAAELAPGTKTELGAQVLGGPLLKARKVVTKPLVEEVIPSLVSTLTGVSKEAAKIRLTKAADPFTKALIDPAKASQILEGTKNALQARRQALGESIGRIVEKVHAKFRGRPAVKTQDIASQAKSLLTDDFGNISPASKNVITLLSTNRGNLTFRQGFQLKQQIQDLIKFKPADITGQRLSPVGTREEAGLKKVLGALDDRLAQTAPQFRKANRAFSEMAKTFEEIDKLFLGKADPQKTALSLLKKGGRERFLLEQLDKKLPAAEKFLGGIEKLLVTTEFAPILRPLPRTGFVGGPVGGALAGGAATLLDPRLAAIIAGTAAATSPRLTGALARGGVEAGRAAIRPLERATIRIPATGAVFSGLRGPFSGEQ